MTKHDALMWCIARIAYHGGSMRHDEGFEYVVKAAGCELKWDKDGVNGIVVLQPRIVPDPYERG